MSRCQTRGFDTRVPAESRYRDCEMIFQRRSVRTGTDR